MDYTVEQVRKHTNPKLALFYAVVTEITRLEKRVQTDRPTDRRTGRPTDRTTEIIQADSRPPNNDPPYIKGADRLCRFSVMAILGKGVRQGCVLSPMLFNIYSEFVMRQVLDNWNGGIPIGGSKINNLRFADDTTLIATSQKELVALLNILEQHSADFVYLGSLIDNLGSCENEIRRRILQARVSMTKLTKIWCVHNITKAIKMSLVQSLVFSICLYAPENWTVKKADRARMDASEMWTWRRILRVPYTAHRTNVSILDELGNPMRLSSIVSKRMLTFFGHIHRSDNMEKFIVQGHAPNGRRRGRSPTCWVDTMKQLLDMSIKSATELTAWTLKAAIVNKIEAFEMYTLRRMLRVSWVDHVRNENVLQRAGLGERELFVVIRKRKIAYLGHIMRGECYHLLRLILQGKIKEIKSVGRCEVVQSFVYLGSLIDSCENEIRRRIQQARVAMTKLTKTWRDHNITKATKMSLVLSLLFSIFFWECLQELGRLAEHNKVTLEWVLGHPGIRGNERVDELARLGSSACYIGAELALGVRKSTTRHQIVEWMKHQHKEQWNLLSGCVHGKSFIKNCKLCGRGTE
ncbi:unnamed protein product [Callosobruchus maculatus]|uniref:Reverse transcriptase domain-containing protein n=1 Tax=Callosobruchus maculatus TaxID=64391 RepID=A0A653BH03_CALMS|nr:unnamed protein product [Callosobruchus maculatus]